MPRLDELDFDNPETCPNCGQFAGGDNMCPNCGAVLFEEDELNPFEEEAEADGQ